jgi:hypothetical protein
MPLSSGYDEERLGRLIGRLPPAPEGWLTAAQELPAARRGLDEIVARAQVDLRFREALIADLEAALSHAGYQTHPPLVEALRRRFAMD